MKIFSSKIRLYTILSMAFGLGMGVVFPFVAQSFMTYNRPIFQIVFFGLCVVAGLLVGAFAIAIGTVTLLKALRKIARQLNTIVQENDLTLKVAVDSDDALGDLAADINVLIGHLRGTFSTLKKDCSELKKRAASLGDCTKKSVYMADKMGAAIDDLSSVANTQMEQAKGIKGSVGEIFNSIQAIRDDIITQSSNINQSTAAIEQMSRNITAVATLAMNAEEVSQRLTDTAGSGEHEVQATVKFIDGIEGAAKGIFDLVNVISVISARTGLLAINAAIEAAHAGNSGQGFAIVAQEVRSLAEESSISVKEISNRIGLIANQIETGLESSGATSQILTTLLNTIKENAEISASFHSTMVEQRIGADQITEAMQNLIRATEEIRESTQRQTELGEHANSSAQSMLSEAEKTLHLAKTHQQVESELRGVVEEIREASTSNQMLSDRLESFLRTFKVDEGVLEPA